MDNMIIKNNLILIMYWCHYKILYCKQQSVLVSPYLSWEERLDVISLHEEHVDEVDEDAGCASGLLHTESQPFVDNHEDQVPKHAHQEEELRDKHQIYTELPSEMPVETQTKEHCYVLYI